MKPRAATWIASVLVSCVLGCLGTSDSGHGGASVDAADAAAEADGGGPPDTAADGDSVRDGGDATRPDLGDAADDGPRSDGGGPGGDIIPADRRVDWRPGIPGGIPERTVICANVRESIPGTSRLAQGDGSADDAPAIQAAIDACPEGQVVYLPAGTYRLASGLQIRKGIVLRGAGPDQTRLEGDQVAQRYLIEVGGYEEGRPETAILSGHDKGSTRIVVADPSGFGEGDLIIVDQLNDGDLVTNIGTEGPAPWASRDDGQRAMGQIVEVTAVDDSAAAITFDPPLAMTLSDDLQPQIVQVVSQPTRGVGIEDLAIADLTDRGDNQGNIRFQGSAYSWIRNVESADVSGRHLQLDRCFRCEIVDSYVHHAHVYQPGAYAYGISLSGQTSESLVENDIAYYLNANFVLEGCGPGNVLAYNYSDVTWGREYPDAPWLMADMVLNHLGHPFMTLLEGNMGTAVGADNIHGSSSHETLFRNYYDREHEGQSPTGNTYAIVLAYQNRYMNLVGNVLGHPGLTGIYEYAGASNCDEVSAIYKIGFISDCGLDDVDELARSTLLRHGNYDYITGQTHWDDAIPTHELPPSLYRTSPPDYFGDVPWPPIGPDVDGLVHDIPAKTRFEQLRAR